MSCLALQFQLCLPHQYKETDMEKQIQMQNAGCQAQYQFCTWKKNVSKQNGMTTTTILFSLLPVLWVLL
jgi:hypothetical protein